MKSDSSISPGSRALLSRKPGVLLWIRLAALLGCVSLGSSCVSVDTGGYFNHANISRLKAGTTTKVEASELFGAPIIVLTNATWKYVHFHFGDETTTELWRYVYGRSTLAGNSSRVLQLEFDREGRLSDYYYESRNKEDATHQHSVQAEFDIFKARQGIAIGRSSRTDVVALVGTNYVVLQFNKPEIAERWHYGYSKKSKEEPNCSYEKLLEVDFDAQGTVRQVKGSSDFPEDLARANLQPQVSPGQQTLNRGPVAGGGF